MAAVELQDIDKAFGRTPVLRGVSLSIAPGEFVALVGPSGCGKTTLMRIAAGLERADGGRVRIAGEDVTDIRAADRDVAMVFQNYALYPHLTVAGNLAVPLALRRLRGAQRLPFVGSWIGDSAAIRAGIEADVRRAAEALGIGGLLDRKPAQLSGGQRQRVALGRAIVRRPKLFLMDEPLSNLDAALRVQTRTEIVAIHRRVGAATIYVTHDQSEAMTMADRVAVMMDGRILQIGTPEAIYADPADLRVAGFIGSPRINTIAAEAAAEGGDVRVGSIPTGVQSGVGGPLTLAIRPEHLTIEEGGLPARVEHVEFLGDSLLVHAAAEHGGEPLIAKLAADDRRRPTVGSRIALRSDPARALLFGPDGRRVASASRQRAPAHV
jgi:multiple sugar transport system ATP-binding protein